MNLSLEKFPILETERLRLRGLRPDDADDVFRLFSQEAVTRYYDLDTFTSRNQAVELIERQLTRFNRHEGIRWAITRRGNEEVIGTCGYLYQRFNLQGGLGYELAEPYWGRGLMTEALQAVVDFGFQQINLNRLQALVVPGNAASVRVLQKLDFKREGLLREYAFFKGEFQDLICFSLLKREYAAGKMTPAKGQ